MTRNINSYCIWHLGDQLIHLNFTRRLSKLHQGVRFVHYCDQKQHGQLAEVIADLPNIQLSGGALPPGCINVWKNTDGFFDRHPNKNDWVSFHLDWFRFLASRLGFDSSPIVEPKDLLFDYPAIQNSRAKNLDFDFLVINSRPGSGQVHYPDMFCFDPLLQRLRLKGYRVACTQETRVPEIFCTASHGLSVTDIGNLSLRTPYIVGVSTGADWITHNAWNIESVKQRIILLDRERLNLPGAVSHVASVEQAMRRLEEMRLI